ncbi:MAG TPA: ATP-binding protein [Cyclobacteriaceae bacterium]|nr:ATP-binding protein [Cyclobacteriaceae bacterium]
MAFSVDPMIIVSNSGSEFTCLSANTSARNIFNCTSNPVGRPFKESFPGISHNEMLKSLGTVTKDSGQSIVKGPGVPYDFLLEHIEIGNTGAILILARPNDESSNPSLPSDKKYERLFEKMDEGFCIIDVIFKGNKPVDYRFIEVNPQFESQSGLKNVTGKTATELVPDLEPEWFDVYGEVATTGEPKRFVQAAEAMNRWFEVNAFKIGDANDKTIAILFNDITERKRAEDAVLKERHRLYDLFVQSPNLVIVFNGPDHVIELANKHALRVWGKDRFEEVYNQPLIQAVPELDGQGIKELLDGVYQTGIPHYGVELKVRLYGEVKTDELEDIYFNFVYQPIFGANKNVEGILVIANIVTDQVIARMKIEESEKKYKLLADELEKRVVQRTHELQRSNEDLQQFAHVASHDLKEPVRKIKTYGNRLDSELSSSDEKSKAYVRKILGAAERMSTMIEGVLNYASMDGSRRQFETINLNDVFNDIEQDLEVLFGQKHGSIVRGDLPSICGVKVLIHQLFYNLINNSLKFSKKDQTPVITVESKVLEIDGNEFARITISDNGIGFDSAYSKMIFDAFSRLHSKDNYDGTGLGLSLCKKIVERHGGTIEAFGQPGKGAIFTLMLPINNVAAVLK